MDNRQKDIGVLETKGNIRAIIISAGEGTRWENYTGIEKHFIKVDNEPILCRTVRLLREFGVDDIYVVGKNKRYEIEGSKLYKPKFTREYHDADKFLSSKDLWNENGKTLVLYGDVYFTRQAINQIVNCSHIDWLLFGRPFGSWLTGKGFGECFAQTFYDNHIRRHREALYQLVDYYNEGVLERIGGWEHYRIMIGIPKELVHIQTTRDRFVAIDDWTEDFDTPEEYNQFMKNFNRAKKIKLDLSQYGNVF